MNVFAHAIRVLHQQEVICRALYARRRPSEAKRAYWQRKLEASARALDLLEQLDYQAVEAARYGPY